LKSRSSGVAESQDDVRQRTLSEMLTRTIPNQGRAGILLPPDFIAAFSNAEAVTTFDMGFQESCLRFMS
jgi:hypothetical protein